MAVICSSRIALGELMHDGGRWHATGFVVQHFLNGDFFRDTRQRNHARLSTAIGTVAGGARCSPAAHMQRIDLGLGQTRQGDQRGRSQNMLNLHGFSSKKQ